MGPRLAALVVDASEGLREREESGLEQLMAGSRILVGAVSHEVRNVCGAIGVIYENLVRQGALQSSKDFEALGSLVETLNKIASMELKQSKERWQASGVDLFEIFDELRIVLEPCCGEAGIEVRWQVPGELPPVWADRHRLLQVLLNLTKNSERALENAKVKRIEIAVSAGAEPSRSGWLIPVPAWPSTNCFSRFRRAPIPPASASIFPAPSCDLSTANCGTTPPCRDAASPSSWR